MVCAVVARKASHPVQCEQYTSVRPHIRISIVAAGHACYRQRMRDLLLVFKEIASIHSRLCEQALPLKPNHALLNSDFMGWWRRLILK